MAQALERGRISSNGVDFAYLAAGAGPLALCLHGFPDTARTWRHLLPDLAAAGFRAVAPFLRGYAPTALATDGDYGLETLVADATALHDAFGANGDAVLVGHDWGAEIAYGAATAQPDRWRRVVTLAVPPAALDDVLYADEGQRERLAYIETLRQAGAEQIVAADGMAFLDRLWSTWSPGYDAAEDGRDAKMSLAEPGHLAAAIAYYRADPPAGVAGWLPPQPTLYLHGEDDGCIDAGLASAARDLLAPGSAFERVAGAGHFLHLERPALVNDRVRAWLA